MNLSRKIFLLCLLCLQFGVGFAQSEKDKIEALRVSFITKKLELSGTESERFWPVYNEYNDKIKALRKNLRVNYRKRADVMTDKDADELYALDMQTKQAEHDLYKQYNEKIKGIIGVKKIVKLRIAEEEFKREIINTIKEKSD